MPSIHDHARTFVLAQPWHWDRFFLSEQGVVFTTPEATTDFNRYLAHEGHLTREQFENNVALEEWLREKTKEE